MRNNVGFKVRRGCPCLPVWGPALAAASPCPAWPCCCSSACTAAWPTPRTWSGAATTDTAALCTPRLSSVGQKINLGINTLAFCIWLYLQTAPAKAAVRLKQPGGAERLADPEVGLQGEVVLGTPQAECEQVADAGHQVPYHQPIHTRQGAHLQPLSKSSEVVRCSLNFVLF